MMNPTVDHKKQLHELVTERSTLLKATLASLQAEQAGSDRARAIEGAIAALQTHVSGGWDKVGEQESAAIVRWLDQSKFLFDPAKPAAPPAPAASSAPAAPDAAKLPPSTN